MNQWTTSTEKTIQKHCKDFTLANYSSKIAGFGGYDKYLRDFLGGVFAQDISKPVKTVRQFRERVEYVQGLMAIWGFDYSNGNDPKTRHYYRWGQGDGTKPAPDAFYQSGYGKCNTGTIAQLCTGSGGRGRTTNCNYGADTALRACGLYIVGTDHVKAWATQYGKPVTEKKKLRPGDIVHFYVKAIKRGDPSTWSAGQWKHVALVVAVEDGKIWLADFGSRFIKTKKPLHYMPVNDSAMAGGEYGSRYWAAIHAFDLEDDTVKVKTDADKAVELKRDIESYIIAKRKEYGDKIADLAKDYFFDEAEYLRAAADYTLNGYAGSGEARKVFFGNDYSAVQGKVNWTVQTAEEVIAGFYGSGDIRKAALGKDYDLVQGEVNRILKG